MKEYIEREAAIQWLREEKIPVKVELIEDGGKVLIKMTNYDGTSSSADITGLLNISGIMEK